MNSEWKLHLKSIFVKFGLFSVKFEFPLAQNRTYLQNPIQIFDYKGYHQ